MPAFRSPRCPRAARRRVPPRRWCRLSVERLEDRVLPSGDVLATARTLAFDARGKASAFGAVATVNDVAIYKFHLNAGDAISVKDQAQVLGSGLDDFLRLFDASGKELLAVDSPTRNTTDAAFGFKAPKAGDYYLGVSSHGNIGYDANLDEASGSGARTGGLTAGFFNLIVTRSHDDDNGRVTPIALGPGITSVPGVIYAPGDVDLYAVSLRAGQKVLAAVVPNGADPNLGIPLDSSLRVFDATGKEIVRGEDFDDPATYDPIIRVGLHVNPAVWFPAAPTGGIYYIAVSNTRNFSYSLQPPPPTQPGGGYTLHFPPKNPNLRSGYGPYVLKITTSADPDAADTTPVTLRAGVTKSISGSIDYPALQAAPFTQDEGPTKWSAVPGDVDVYPVNLAAGETLTAQIDTTSVHSSLRALIEVEDPTGDVSRSPDPSAGPPTLALTASVTGTYYVRVSGYDHSGADPFVGYTGAYVLDLTKDGPRPADLSVRAFSFFPPRADWGQSEPTGYIISNQGQAAAARFGVEVWLSEDGKRGGTSVRLARVEIPGLAGGASVSGSVTVPLPAVPPVGFSGLGHAYLVLWIDPDGWVAEADRANNADAASLTIASLPTEVEPNDDFTGANLLVPGSPTSGSLGPGDRDLYRLVLGESGRLTAQIRAVAATARLSLWDGQGRLIVQTNGAAGDQPRLDWHLQVMPADSTYYLEVEDRAGAGPYMLDTTFQAANAPFQPITLGNGLGAQAVVVGDFNHDGVPDLAVADTQGGSVEVLQGVGDGTYRPPVTYRAGDALPKHGPWAIVAAHLSGDADLDLATANGDSRTISIFRSHGDGTFDSQIEIPVGDLSASNDRAVGLAVGDFNRDGVADLAVTNSYPESDGNFYVSVFLGQGGGRFPSKPTAKIPVGARPWGIVAGDFNGDGRVDLAFAEAVANRVGVLLGDGRGGFQPEKTFSAQDPAPATGQAAPASQPHGIVSADFNGDGRPDLAVADFGSGEVSVFLATGGSGLFSSQLGNRHLNFLVGNNPQSVAAADVNGDGVVDLVVADQNSNDISLLAGAGDGDFAPAVAYAVGGSPWGLAVADLNGDGIPDLAVTDSGSSRLFVVPGLPNHTFPAQALLTGSSPAAVVAGDFNGDGKPDLATVNLADNNVSVLLGAGDGTVLAQTRVRVGDHPGEGAAGKDTSSPFPDALVAADFNDDGRLDLATADSQTGDVTVLLGNGDGHFQPLKTPAGAPTFATGPYPTAMAAADFNHDGHADLVVANAGSGEGPGSVSLVLWDSQTGTFDPPQSFPVGVFPKSLVTGDFNGDGYPDLAAADTGSNDLAVFLWDRQSKTFGPEIHLPAGAQPIALVAANLSGDPRPHSDLAVANFLSGDVSVFFWNVAAGRFDPPVRLPAGTAPAALAAGNAAGDGGPVLAAADFGSNDVAVWSWDPNAKALVPRGRYAVGTRPVSILAADFSGYGRTDFAVGNGGSGDISLLSGQGGGRFAPEKRYPAGSFPGALVAADLNGDGLADLAAADTQADGVSVLLGVGDGTLAGAGSVTRAVRSAPVVGDVVTPGVPDLLAMKRDGTILFRRGQAAAGPGFAGFATPVKVNPTVAARDMAVVGEGGRRAVAALDLSGSAVDLYVTADGGHTFQALPQILSVPGGRGLHLAAGDLTGDGRDDLVVATANGTLAVFVPGADETFRPQPIVLTGAGTDPSELDVTDVNADGRADLVVTDEATGKVAVFLNQGAGVLAAPWLVRAGTGPYRFDVSAATGAASGEGTLGAVSIRLSGDVRPGLAVLNQRSGTLSLLRAGATGPGDPQVAFAFDPGARPTAIRNAGLGANGWDELAVLDEATGQVDQLAQDGRGGFRLVATLFADTLPTGLSVRDVNGDGRPDLLVSNSFGDVLLYARQADGTFRLTPLGGKVSLADTGRKLSLVGGTDATGRPLFFFTDQQTGQLALQHGNDPASVRQLPDPRHLLAGPTAVRLGDLNGDAVPDLVVANSGGNDVLVYLGNPNGTFQDPLAFAAGTDPVAVEVAGDLNGDGKPDLVVSNERSDDVSVLLSGLDQQKLGQGSAAQQAWTLTQGPRLQAGDGPVSALVADVPGHAHPDLVVVNAQSDNVFILPGVGDGYFDDRSPVALATGADPVQAFLGRFEGAGLELVTLDAGSRDLTVFDLTSADFAAPQPRIPLGEERPEAAFTGDFNGDGAQDLLVADNATGLVTLVLGGLIGLTPEGALRSSEVPSPTDLAEAGGQVYAVTVGSDAVFLVGSLGDFVSVPVASLSAGPPGGAGFGPAPAGASPSEAGGVEVPTVTTPVESLLRPGDAFEEFNYYAGKDSDGGSPEAGPDPAELREILREGLGEPVPPPPEVPPGGFAPTKGEDAPEDPGDEGGSWAMGSGWCADPAAPRAPSALDRPAGGFAGDRPATGEARPNKTACRPAGEGSGSAARLSEGPGREEAPLPAHAAGEARATDGPLWAGTARPGSEESVPASGAAPAAGFSAEWAVDFLFAWGWCGPATLGGVEQAEKRAKRGGRRAAAGKD